MERFSLPDIIEEKTVLKTIRIKYITMQKIEKLAKENNLSVNRVLNECIEFALDNLSEEFLQK